MIENAKSAFNKLKDMTNKTSNTINNQILDFLLKAKNKNTNSKALNTPVIK